MTFETDKCTEQFTMRIPEVLKIDLDKLSKTQKVALLHDLMLAIARAVHDSKFNPELYLKSD